MSDRCVDLKDQDLVGAEGGQCAADILRLLHPHTEILDLGWNHQLGHKGLKALVQGMMAREEPEWRLKKIDLSNCELGGANGESTEASLHLVTQLLRLIPSLEHVSVGDNHFKNLSSLFVQALMTLPKLEGLNLSENPIGNSFLRMMSSNQSSWALKELDLSACHLGGMDSEASLDQLAQLLRLTPLLEHLNLCCNNLNRIPSSFVHALISLPTLKYLDLSSNPIDSFFRSMTRDRSTRRLKTLEVIRRGLEDTRDHTDTDSQASLDQLAQLLRLTPSLAIHNISSNCPNSTSFSFVHALMSLPKLEYLDLSYNDRGASFLKQMINFKHLTWRLKGLYLCRCRLGGTNSDASLNHLTQLLRSTPSLERLDIGNNDLVDLPASFINTLISHPRLEALFLDGNPRLGRSLDPSTPCSINRLLSQLCTVASSSALTLRFLELHGLGMTAKCCGPILEQVLGLGSKGVRDLDLDLNGSLRSHGTTLAQIISNDNFNIQYCSIEGLHNPDKPASQMLEAALERNRRLAKETQEAACGILKVSRVVLLGAPGPLRSYPELAEPLVHSRLLDLPSELLYPILSYIYPGALSDRQLLSVVQLAADRATLLPTTLEPETVERAFQTKDEFLKETGCDSYDR